jgi:hypothetical protein
MHILTTAAALVCVMLHGPALSRAPAPDAIGFIADISGRWDISHGSGAKPVAAERKAVLHAGDVLQKLDDDPSSFVAVATYAAKIEKYQKTAYLTGRAPAGTLARIMAAVQQRFQEGWINASVRGGSEFSDAIVKSENGRTDVSPVFKNAADGAYTLTIYAIVGGKLTSPARATARIAGARAATIPALPPGLYQIDAAGAEPGIAGNAWIRVVPAGEFDQAAKEFRELPSAGEVAGADLRKAARAVSRAYLIVTSDAAPPKR